MPSIAQYQTVWDEIKTAGSAKLVVHKGLAETVVEGVKHAKCDENMRRKNAGLVYWSKLVIKRKVINSEQVRLEFSLCYQTKI